MNKVKVIVSKCRGEGDNCRSYMLVREHEFSSVETALLAGNFMKESGYSIIVRPMYNEADILGNFFREFRSLHGESFKEIRWIF